MTLHPDPPQTDHELLDASHTDLMAENRHAAARSARLVAFFHRRAAALDGDDSDPRKLSAREETAVEASELWATPEAWIRSQLNNSLWIDEYFPYLQDLAAAGRVDPFRSRLIAETARHSLDTAEEYTALVERLTPFIDRHLRPDGILACSHKQLRNRLSYIIRVLRRATAEERFHQSHEARDVQINNGEDGMSWLTIAGTTDQAELAFHRLTLSARALRTQGDSRTINQLRADLAVELIISGTTDATKRPDYARPIINLTVPIQTVMGLSDHPGMLSGGQVIPASLARMIAQRPGSTWHRMLTDPAGHAIEVSTERYRPTRPIWEQVVAEWATCFRPNCDRSSTTCDLDHRRRWPIGSTTRRDLWPGCRTDHRVKHAPGFSIEQTESGGFALRTAAGFRHEIVETEHPSTDEWIGIPRTIQSSATELHEALDQITAARRKEFRPRPDLLWEHNLHFGLFYDEAS